MQNDHTRSCSLQLKYLLTKFLKLNKVNIEMKKLTALAISGVTYLSLASHTFAQTYQQVSVCPPEGKGFARLCGGANIGSLISGIIQIAFVGAVVIALAFLIFGGFKWITSGGDKAGVEGARGMIVAALVGLVVVFLSYFILSLLLQVFTGAQLNSLSLPQIIFQQ